MVPFVWLKSNLQSSRTVHLYSSGIIEPTSWIKLPRLVKTTCMTKCIFSYPYILYPEPYKPESLNKLSTLAKQSGRSGCRATAVVAYQPFITQIEVACSVGSALFACPAFGTLQPSLLASSATPFFGKLVHGRYPACKPTYQVPRGLTNLKLRNYFRVEGSEGLAG